MSEQTIVVCAEIADPRWHWLQQNFSDDGIRFEIVRCVARQANPRFNIARLSGAFEAIRVAQRTGAKAIVAHGPTLAAWCGLFARVLRAKIPIVAHSFNFTEMPSPAKRPIFAAGLSNIDRFVVYSTVERALYAEAFGLDPERFDVVLWGVRPPEVDTPETPMEKGEYVCAVGGNARDYRTLMDAARKLPGLRFVVVARLANLAGLDMPANVTVHTDLPFAKTMNIISHSRFMVLPLVNSEVPCGHVTLVAAMHLGKAFIVTDSAGVSDYVRNNGLTVAAGSAGELAAAIDRLWADPALSTRLGESGRAFAASECSEERIADHFRNWMRSRGLLPGSAGDAAAEAAAADKNDPRTTR